MVPCLTRGLPQAQIVGCFFSQQSIQWQLRLGITQELVFEEWIFRESKRPRKVPRGSKHIRDRCSNIHNDYYELVSRGDFNRNKNYLEENQGFVNCQQNLNSGMCIFPLLSGLASYVESIELKKSITVFFKFLSLSRGILENWTQSLKQG